LSLSVDGGATWLPLAGGPKAGRFDLTPHVAGAYGYLLRVDLDGEPAKALVRKLAITTWVQVAPASLPTLAAGKNVLEYRSGDHYGLASRVLRVSSDTSKPDELRKCVLRMPEDYDPVRKTARISGEVIVPVTAPPGSRIAWFTAEGSFRTHQQESATQTRNTMAYAVDSPGNFEEIYRARMPVDMGHWHYNAAREIRLEKPARQVYVRYFGDPAVNNFKVHAHCVDDRPRAPSPVVITHVWTDGKTERTARVRPGPDGRYEIEAGAAPVDLSIEIAVPSDDGGRNRAVAVAPLDAPVAVPVSASQPDWVEPMLAVHARFEGTPGTFAQFGDSITDSRAFWTSLRWKRDHAGPEMQEAFRVVSNHMLEDCWDRKGPEYGNQGGQTIGWADENLAAWLERLQPEAAILMFGTNDLNKVGVEDYERTLHDVVRRCLDRGTVIILSTIPPCHGHVEKSAEFAGAACRVAAAFRVPLVDFHAEILRRRPDDWDGALDRFAAFQGYDVPTLIARDGVHPSNPARYRADYSPEALNANGFSLRNYLVLVKYAEVIQKVFQP
ncbi:MAG: SGNH/GDSL hydrolase family protein, partial [Thermoguttaceae bacterium]